MANATMRDISGRNGHLANMRAFTGNSLSGHMVPAGRYYGGYGQLPANYRTMLADAIERGDVVYMVRSYQTPIAWVIMADSGQLAIVPDVRYSVTTSRHQGAARAWLAYPTQSVNQVMVG